MKQQQPSSSQTQVSGLRSQPSDGLNSQPSDDDVLVRVENVSKKFCRDLKKSLWYGMKDLGSELIGQNRGSDELRSDEFWAVRDVSFELRRGECLGLIGRNGAGKTTLLRMLNGLIKPDKGRIEMCGRVGALIALGAGFNPILTGRENIYVNAAVLGLSKRETDKKLEEILEFAELGEFIDAPVQTYSSGMQVRLGFSIATALKPEILLLDEVLAVGDSFFRGKCFKRIGKILKNSAVVFVSHNEAQISRICNSTILLEKGIPLVWGKSDKALDIYRKDILATNPEIKIIKDENVEEFFVLNIPNFIEWGAKLKFKIQVNMNKESIVAFVLLHFTQNSDFKANAEIRLNEKNIEVLKQGKNIFLVSVGPIYLSSGNYQLSFSIFDNSFKSTILQVFDFSTIEVIGPIGSGNSHLLPMEFETLNGL